MNIQHALLIILLCYSSFSSAMDEHEQPSSSDYHPSLSTPEPDLTDLRTLSRQSSAHRDERSMSAFNSEENSNAFYDPKAAFRFLTVEELHSPEFVAEGLTIRQQSRSGKEPEALAKEKKRTERRKLDVLTMENNDLRNQLALERDQKEALKLQLAGYLARIEELERHNKNKRNYFCACLKSSE